VNPYVVHTEYHITLWFKIFCVISLSLEVQVARKVPLRDFRALFHSRLVKFNFRMEGRKEEKILKQVIIKGSQERKAKSSVSFGRGFLTFLQGCEQKSSMGCRGGGGVTWLLILRAFSIHACAV
jgi:hypothetical protein